METFLSIYSAELFHGVLHNLMYLALAGWGPEVFSYYSHWWIVPVVASHLGAIGKYFIKIYLIYHSIDDLIFIQNSIVKRNNLRKTSHGFGMGNQLAQIDLVFLNKLS